MKATMQHGDEATDLTTMARKLVQAERHCITAYLRRELARISAVSRSRYFVIEEIEQLLTAVEAGGHMAAIQPLKPGERDGRD